MNQHLREVSDMDKSTYVRDLQVEDENGSIVEMELHRHPNGGYFAIDFSYIDQVSEEIWDPFSTPPRRFGLGNPPELSEGDFI
jgi:hypothetical protein